MKKQVFLTVLLMAASLLLSASSLPPARRAMNAVFIHWQRLQPVIHIFAFSDQGRPGQPPAQVRAGRPLLFGFEWGDPEGTVEDLQAFIDNPKHDITVSVDGGPAFSVKPFYQDAFFAQPGSGPRWSWDHDADGLGDGDGDGIGDWYGPVVFFRFPYPGLRPGTHTFQFTVYDPEFTGSETITVEVYR